MSNDQFFDDCLGCGLEFTGGVLGPVVDGDTITHDGVTISADDSVAATDIVPIDGVQANPDFPDGCNGLKFDCETGAIWYDTPACHLRLVNRAGRIDFVNETAVAAGSRSNFSTLAEPIDLDDCYEGMTAVIIGYTEFSTVISAAQEANTPDGGTVDPVEYLNGYQVRYQFTLSTGGTTIFTENMLEGTHMPGYQLSRRCLTHTIPFVACYDPALGLGQEVTINVANSYRNNTGTALADITSSFVTSSKAFVMKER